MSQNTNPICSQCDCEMAYVEKWLTTTRWLGGYRLDVRSDMAGEYYECPQCGERQPYTIDAGDPREREVVGQGANP